LVQLFVYLAFIFELLKAATERPAPAIRRVGAVARPDCFLYDERPSRGPGPRTAGDVAEWLKATVC
jgi:hypothetical protein